MNVNIYLPDDLGEWAKAHDDVKLSALLREALVQERERRGEAAGSKILDGVYLRRARNSSTVVIHLNTANDAKGNGVNLVPSDRLPEPERGRLSLNLTAAAVRRICERAAAESEGGK